MPAVPTPSRLFAILSGSAGNLVEWYDWYIYSAASLYFAPVFFPKGDPTTQLLQTAAVFAVGFFCAARRRVDAGYLRGPGWAQGGAHPVRCHDVSGFPGDCNDAKCRADRLWSAKNWSQAAKRFIRRSTYTRDAVLRGLDRHVRCRVLRGDGVKSVSITRSKK